MGILMAGLALYLGVMPAIIVLAIWRGDWDERWGAIALLAGIIASQIAPLISDSHWRAIQIPLMVTDALLFVALLVVVHHSRKFWPIWAAAAQLIGTVGHLAPAFFPKILAKIYLATQAFWVFPILVALLVGTLGAMRQAGRPTPPA
jgi:cytochrome bd-type quinol oxidase subunit 2